MAGLVVFLVVWVVAAQGEASAWEALVATLMLVGIVGLFRLLASLPLIQLVLMLLGIGVFLGGCDDE